MVIRFLKENYITILIYIFLLFAGICAYLYLHKDKKKEDVVLLVKETKYFHKNDKDCKYIDDAKEKDYKILERTFDFMITMGCKMCKSCFSDVELDAYENKVREYNDYLRSIKLEEQEQERQEKIRERNRDSLVNSVSDDVYQAIKEIVLKKYKESDEFKEDILFEIEENEELREKIYEDYQEIDYDDW